MPVDKEEFIHGLIKPKLKQTPLTKQGNLLLSKPENQALRAYTKSFLSLLSENNLDHHSQA